MDYGDIGMTDFTVATFGFAEREQRVLMSVLSISSGREPTFYHYTMTDDQHADIILINGDVTEVSSDWVEYQKVHTKQKPSTIIKVSEKSKQESGDSCNYQMRRPILASRLLSLLESVVINELGYEPVAAIQADSPVSEAPVPHYDKGIEVLVVDDSLTARIQLKNALNDIASHVDLAETGEEALGLLAKRRYDIIFLDTILPGIDGFTVCKVLKKNPKNGGVPVVMISASNSPKQWLKGKLAGCEAYLSKPVKKSVFDETLKKCLQIVDESDTQIIKRVSGGGKR
jgi:twitching motility two-component system response regulator PilG